MTDTVTSVKTTVMGNKFLIGVANEFYNVTRC